MEKNGKIVYLSNNEYYFGLKLMIYDLRLSSYSSGRSSGFSTTNNGNLSVARVQLNRRRKIILVYSNQNALPRNS